jgi:uncharacterized coiled-coil protein SlyX
MAPKQTDRSKEKEKERKSTCVGCKKKFTKSEYCVICGMCNYWYHKTCAGMSDDIYKCVDQHFKDHGYTFWNCQPCSSYAKGITARMKELEGRLDEVERQQDQQDDKLKEVDGKVAKVDKEVKKLAGKLNEVQENSGGNVFNELRERHVRRYNVVLYGVGEAEGDRPTVEEKRDWDAKSCQNVFDALKLGLKANSFRYLRRLGEKGEKPRPLLVGMRTIEDKELLLENAKYLRDTHLYTVGISTDLTPQEIQEEKEMEKEAGRRNQDLSREDRAKNLKWLVVGQKGEKRLIKVVERVRTTNQQQGQRRGPANRGQRHTGPTPQERSRAVNNKRDHSGTESEPDSPNNKQRKRPNRKRSGGDIALAEEEVEVTETGDETVDMTDTETEPVMEA